MLFRDRFDAGRQLASALSGYLDRDDVLVLALPRGGVPVGFEIARALRAPLDVFAVRKLPTPGRPELAMGALAPGGVRVLNEDVLRHLGLTHEQLESVVRGEEAELARREAAFRSERPRPRLEGRTAILVDDGLATGATMKVAVTAARLSNPKRIVIAAPVAAPRAVEELATTADQVVCLATPLAFNAVGQWYGDFTQTTDDEVRDLLARAAREVALRGSR